MIGCGTAYNSCLTAKYWFEELTDLDIEIDIASEFRYRNLKFNSNNLYIFVSQSGETADTAAALEICKKNRVKTCSIVNVIESTIARNSDWVLPIHAGTEIGVASTKAFLGQLTVLYILCLKLAYVRKDIDEKTYIEKIKMLLELCILNLFRNFEFENQNSYVWKQNIPVQEIMAFLQGFQSDENEGRFNIADILRYIRRRTTSGEALSWSVILAGKSVIGEQIFPSIDQPINKFGRGSVGNGRIDQLTDENHLCLDLDNVPPEANLRQATITYRNPNSPLLIVYVLDKDYQPTNANTNRGRNYVGLFNGLRYSLDTVGLGIVFPDSPSITEEETNQYYSTRGIPID